MKVKHNKKRNTAFLYEALVRELTKAVVERNTQRSKAVRTILKEHFRRGTVLFSELGCFSALSGGSEGLTSPKDGGPGSLRTLAGNAF